MKALVIYESMYGNTHLIASAVGDGLREYGDVTVASVNDVGVDSVRDVDLMVVGGPTHAHGMTRATTRSGAVAAAEKPGAEVELDADPDAYGLGLREWFDSLDDLFTNAAAFDTRVEMPAAFTGRASKGIARRLRRHGATVIVEPESFFVTKANELEPHEEGRARDWGRHLGASLRTHVPS